MACFCGLRASYRECCAPLLAGRAVAATPEQLMRSRYTAFVARDAAYLRSTWHPSTRPPTIAFDEAISWERLEVVRAGESGAESAGESVVEFRAYFRRGLELGVQHEVSRFERGAQGWRYVGSAFGH